MARKLGRNIHKRGHETKSWRMTRKIIAKSSWYKPDWTKKRKIMQEGGYDENDDRKNINKDDRIKRRRTENTNNDEN